MKRNRLRNVSVSAISIVRKGANNKRIFLFKSGDEQADHIVTGNTIIKADDDWSAFYAVVAEPDWEEKPGMIGDQESVDVWDSEDEIRKTAHGFLKSGGLINRMHETLEPYGELVESAVALEDFSVNGETIKKGSWYVAVEPTEDGKQAIRDGEFTGISIEGHGDRIEVEKRDVSTAERKRLASKGKALPGGGFPINSEQDLKNAIQAIGRAKNPETARAHIIRRARAMGKTSLLPDSWTLRKADIAAVSLDFDEDAVTDAMFYMETRISKDAALVPDKPGANNWIDRTGTGNLPKYIGDIAGDLITERGKTTGQAIQMAIGIVRNWCSGQGNVTAATRAKACAAVAEFNAKRAQAHLQKLECEACSISGMDDRTTLQKIKDVLTGADLEGNSDDSATLEDEMDEAKLNEQIEKSVGEAVDGLDIDSKIADAIAEAQKPLLAKLDELKPAEEESETPDAEKLSERVEEIAKAVSDANDSLVKLSEDVDSIATGQRSENGNDDTPVRKSDNPLAGLLS